MFRVRESEAGAGYAVAALGVFLALLVALLANLGSLYLVFQEFRLLDTWLTSPEAFSGVALESLRSQVGLQLVSTFMVSVTLLLCAVALWWLRRRYLVSQKSLRRVKMLAHDILASMDQGVVTTDRQGRITSINTAAIKLLGIDCECVGQALGRICSAELPLVAVQSQVDGCRSPVRDREFTLSRNGGLRRLEGDADVLEDTAGKTLGCVIHLRDVTDRKLMEERLRRMERYISLGALASGLHHEIKNPLTALSIHVQLLEEHLHDADTSGSVGEILGVLKTEVHRLNGVLESFRNFANLQQLTVQPTDALEVIENAIRLIRPQATQQQVQISLLHAETRLPLVPLDAEKFEQVLLNVMINALEAMPAGGNLTVSAAIQEGSLQVEIGDTGPGIPPEIRANLFKPYFSTKSQGTGMGLALTEKLVGQHGGQIDYTSGSCGTTFRLVFPLDQGEARS